jgi:hypothetical protein
MSLLFRPVAFARSSSSAAILSGKLTDNTVLINLTSYTAIHYTGSVVKVRQIREMDVEIEARSIVIRMFPSDLLLQHDKATASRAVTGM